MFSELASSMGAVASLFDELPKTEVATVARKQRVPKLLPVTQLALSFSVRRFVAFVPSELKDHENRTSTTVGPCHRKPLL
jgi:hypothetical protein